MNKTQAILAMVQACAALSEHLGDLPQILIVRTSGDGQTENWGFASNIPREEAITVLREMVEENSDARTIN